MASVTHSKFSGRDKIAESKQSRNIFCEEFSIVHVFRSLPQPCINPGNQNVCNCLLPAYIQPQIFLCHNWRPTDLASDLHLPLIFRIFAAENINERIVLMPFQVRDPKMRCLRGVILLDWSLHLTKGPWLNGRQACPLCLQGRPSSGR
jgi:hypothetical protein